MIARRALRRFLAFALIVAAGGWGAWWGLAHTGAGQELVTRLARKGLDDLVDGTVTVGATSGSLVSGLTARDVKLWDADSTLVAEIPAVSVGYDLLDILRGRVVLRRMTLVQPVINIVQHRNGRLNVEELLRLGRPGSGKGGGGGPKSLIAFRSVTIVKGTVFLKLQAGRRQPGSEYEEGSDGVLRVRRFDELDADLPLVRVSSPDDPGVRIDVGLLAVKVTDPAVVITRATGRVLVAGDSVSLDLRPVGVGRSLAFGGGTIRLLKDTTLYDLRFDGDPVYLEDLHWLFPSLPGDAVARGQFTVLSRRTGSLLFRFARLSLVHHEGMLEGSGAVVVGPEPGAATLVGMDLTARNLDLEFVRPFLDTLPVAGRLSGRARADGSLDSLVVNVDWAFRDTVARTVNEIRARGAVRVGGSAGITFHPLYLERVALQLATIRELVPALDLPGMWEAAGTLEGPWQAAQLSGTVLYHDGVTQGPPSLVRGVIALDARGDTLGVTADVEADSLNLEAFAAHSPGLPFRGRYAGGIRLSGTLGQLEVHADLAGPPGRFRADGGLALAGSSLGARDFRLSGEGVNLARLVRTADLPASRLNFVLVANGDVDAPEGQGGAGGAGGAGGITFSLTPSDLGGVRLDTAFAEVRLREGLLKVDTLELRMPGLKAHASGAIGRQRGASGSLVLAAQADTLSSLDPLVRGLLGLPTDSVAPEDRLDGRASARVVVSGRLDSAAIEGGVTAPWATFQGWSVIGGRLTGSLPPAASPQYFDARVEADSLALGDRGFGAVEAWVAGRADSLNWFARSRIGDVGAFLGGGRYRRDGATARYSLDSLAVLLADGVWLLSAPVVATDADTGLTVTRFELAALGGSGKVVGEGRLPSHDFADLSLRFEAFPMAGVYTLLGGDTVGVAGAVTASLRVTGTRAEPIATGSLALSQGQFGAFRAPRVVGQVDYRNRLLTGALRLLADSQQVVSVDVRLPLDLALESVPQRELPGPLEVRARADSMDLAVLDALTDLFTDVRGRLDADVAVAGSWEEPRLTGGMQIRGGAAGIAGLGVRYDNMNGSLRLAGDTIRFDSLTVTSGGGREGGPSQGTARVGGFIRLERLTRPRLDLAIQARNFRALDLRSYLALTATGSLALQGPVFGATLSGRLVANSGVLFFTDLVTKQIVNLDDPEVADLIDTTFLRRARLGPEFHNRFFDSLRIRDLTLEMGSDVWMRSSEANFQLTGGLAVVKDGAQYRFDGTLNAPRGTYRLNLRFLSREFVVTRGQVRFFGTPDLNPELDIEARHVVRTLRDQRDVTIYVRIGGTLLFPTLTLESDQRPPLAQTEIFSYLLFGAPTFELAEGQSGQRDAVRQALSSVAGVLSSEVERALVSDLGLPLDYVEIRPGAGGDPVSTLTSSQVAFGVQIGRKTFLTLNAGFCPNRTVRVSNTLGASLQFRVSQEWRTELGFEPVRQCTEAGGTADNTTPRHYQLGLDFLWERRY